MKNYINHSSNVYNDVSVEDVKEIQETKTKTKTRLVRCIAIKRNIETNEMFSLWQYILKRTLKPSGKSSCFLEKIV